MFTAVFSWDIQLGSECGQYWEQVIKKFLEQWLTKSYTQVYMYIQFICMSFVRDISSTAPLLPPSPNMCNWKN